MSGIKNISAYTCMVVAGFGLGFRKPVQAGGEGAVRSAMSIILATLLNTHPSSVTI